MALGFQGEAEAVLCSSTMNSYLYARQVHLGFLIQHRECNDQRLCGSRFLAVGRSRRSLFVGNTTLFCFLFRRYLELEHTRRRLVPALSPHKKSAGHALDFFRSSDSSYRPKDTSDFRLHRDTI